MKSAFWRTLAIVAIVAMPTLANANDATIGSEAATSAMSGSTLNNTSALFNAWPHLVTMYGNGAEISTSNFGTNVNAGMGKVWWEAYDELWLNLNVGRRDLGSQAANFLWGGPISNGFTLGGFGDQLEGLDAITNPWFNVGIAKPLAGGGAWSANVFLGSESFEDETADPTYQNSATGYGALLSWGNGEGLHLAGEFAMVTETNEQSDPELEGDVMSFSLNGRYDTDLYKYQGSFVYMTSTEQNVVDGAANDMDTDFLGFLANAGRFLKNEVDGQTSAEFVFAYTTTDMNDVTSSSIVLPGVRVSAWEKLSDTFGVMGGFQSVYALNSTDDTSSSQGLDYAWTAGLFAQFTENVRVDFELAPGGLDNVLSLGNEEELIAYLGATVGLN
jgi:hypothetical protein